MTRPILLLIIPLLAFTCEPNTPNADTIVSNTQTDTSGNTQRPTPTGIELSKLDSIDRANHESVLASGDNITKAFVPLKYGDSSINLIPIIRQDHRIFGYANPDLASEKLLLLSIFTNDVENNPFGCKFGAYYGTGGMENLMLKYLSTTENFVEAVVIDKANQSSSIIYFEKKWIELE